MKGVLGALRVLRLLPALPARAAFRPLLQLALVAIAPVDTAFAHSPSEAMIELSPTDHGATIRWDVAVRDLDARLDLDADRDGALRWGELRARLPELTRFVLAGMTIGAGDADCALAAQHVGLRRHGELAYLALQVDARCPASNGAPRPPFSVRYRLFGDFDRSHRALLRAGTQAMLLTPDDLPRALPAESSPSGERAPQQMRGFIAEGVHHILTGWDHLAFLALLLAPAALRRESGRWVAAAGFGEVLVQAVRVVTAFTLAHSITLALAVLGVVRPPAELIEPAIAATVVWAAWRNLRPARTTHRWASTFAFGLVHGFGFANALSEAGIAGGTLGAALLGFNLGVELGQLLVVGALLPLLWRLRHADGYAGRAMPAMSWALAALGVAWFVQRTAAWVS